MVLALLVALQQTDLEVALLENRYQDAVKLLKEEARTAAREGDREKVVEISESLKEISSVEREYRKVRRYDGQEDPISFRIMGRFECFVKGAWNRGLLLLKKSDDFFLKALAEKELGGGGPLEIADSWWTGSTEVKTETGLTGATGSVKERVDKRTLILWRSRMIERALHWYEAAWPSLSSERDRVRERVLSAVRLDLKAPRRSNGQPEGWHPLSPYWGSSLLRGVSRSGKSCVSLDVPSKENKEGFAAIQSLQARATPEKPYVGVAWVLSAGTDTTGIVEVRFFDSSGTPIKGFVSGFPIDYPFWKKVSVECEAPPGTSSVAIDIRAKISSGVIWVDDASISGPEGELLKNGSFEGN